MDIKQNFALMVATLINSKVTKYNILVKRNNQYYSIFFLTDYTLPFKQQTMEIIGDTRFLPINNKTDKFHLLGFIANNSDYTQNVTKVNQNQFCES